MTSLPDPSRSTTADSLPDGDLAGFVIGSHAAHALALAEVSRLWEAAAGTPDSDRLEALVGAVVAYEEIHWPIEVPTAPAMLAWRLEELDEDPSRNTRAAVAGIVGGQDILDEMLAGTRTIDPEMLFRLARLPGLEILRPGEGEEEEEKQGQEGEGEAGLTNGADPDHAA